MQVVYMNNYDSHGFIDFIAFSGLCLVFVESVFELSSVQYIPACTDVNGTVYRYSLTHSTE